MSWLEVKGLDKEYNQAVLELEWNLSPLLVGVCFFIWVKKLGIANDWAIWL